MPLYRHCYEEPFNQGHFEKGIFIPDCKQCGKCCEGFWLKFDKEPDYQKFDLLHRGSVVHGNVLHVYAPCRHLGEDHRCQVHEAERPDCCKRFGSGDYYHPPGCAFDEGK